MKIWLLRVGFSLIWAAAGLWMARLTLLAFRQRRDWKVDGVIAEGEIVDFEQREDTDPTDRRPLFAPVVVFELSPGAIRRLTSATALRPNPYVVGQKVPVRYRRSNPQVADLDSVTGSLLAPLALLTMAIVCLVVSLLPFLLKPPAAR